jgi:drug/metabolite transporter (DMT)-like permease
MGQRRAPPTDAAVILSTETVFAVFSGWLVLGETLTAQQWLGCGLMLGGMLLAQARSSILKE